MNTTTKRYRLLKDLPTAKAGTIYYKGHGGRYYAEDKVVAGEHDYVVETAPDWFEEVKDAPFEIKFQTLNKSHEHGWTSSFLCFKPIPEKHWVAIKKAIEDIVNGVDAPDIDQLQREAFDAARYKNLGYSNGVLSIVGFFYPTFDSYKNRKK